MTQRLSALPELTDVSSDQQASATSATLVIDRTTASRFGITAQAIDDTLYDAFGQRQIATLFTQLNQYHVIEEVDPKFQLTTDGLAHLYVRSPLTNALVPLNTLTKVENNVSLPGDQRDGHEPEAYLPNSRANAKTAKSGQPDALISIKQKVLSQRTGPSCDKVALEFRTENCPRFTHVLAPVLNI